MNLGVNLCKALSLLTVSAILLVGVTACKPQETELSFETIEQNYHPDNTKRWEGKEPRLIVITSTQDVEDASRFVTDEALAALRKLDFTVQFAILAFRGLQGHDVVRFNIESVLRQGNEVNFYAQPGTDGPTATESSPYHLISVNKEGNWNADFTFRLYLDQTGVAAASTTHHMP